jgi:hypothetical protein
VPASFLLADKAVQEELELSPEQVRKARAAREKDEDARERIESGPGDEADKRWREVLAESDKAVTDILRPPQLKRFRQLRLQQAGAVALADPKLADDLKLTADQRKAIKAIAEDRLAKFKDAFADTTRTEREVGARFTETTKAADAAVRKVLTADQRAKWEELLGKPFRWPSP